MNNNLYFLLLLLSILCWNCSKFKQKTAGEQGEVIKIKLSSIQDTTHFSDLYNRYEVILLETTNESLISQIVNIVKEKDKYFVGDNRIHKVLVFDSTGKYLYSIGRQGRGPGEYRNLADFTIGPDSIVYVLGDNSRSIYTYRKDGTFITHFPIHPATNLAVDNDYIYLYANSLGHEKLKDTSSHYQLYITDKTGREVGHFLLQGSIKAHPNPMIYNMARPFAVAAEGFIFSMLLHETIYTLNKGVLSPWITLSYGKHDLPDSFLADFPVESQKNPHANLSDFLYKKGYASNLHFVFAVFGGVMFQVEIDQRQYRLWLKDGKLQHIEDNLLGGLDNLIPYSMNEHEYISTLSASAWLLFLQHEKDHNLKEKMKSFIRMDENSNPAIIRYWKE
jgi:hypothetical protein